MHNNIQVFVENVGDALRQGDVRFEKVAALPEGAVATKEKIVARGEHSHHHHILKGDATMFRAKNERGDELSYIQVGPGGALLCHDNEITKTLAVHQYHQLTEGTYLYKPQREYNPEEEEARAVRD